MPILLLLSLLVARGRASAAAFAPALTRAPYLTDLVGSHVNVNWATNQSATTGSLRWGPVSGGSCTLPNTLTATRSGITVGTVSEYQWKASLSLPGTGTYCYRPLLASTDLLATNSSPQFQTQVAASDNTPFSFDVFGDWGMVDSTGANPDQAALHGKIAASGARFAVSVGDNGYPNGSQVNYGDLQQTAADTSAVFGPSFWTVAGSTIPLFPAAGNHGLSGTTHTDITTWTEDSAVSSSSGRYQNDVYCCVNGSSSANYASEWYAFDAGPARFYMLDSAWGDSNIGTGSVYANDAAAHFTPGTPEYTWLLNDLKTHPSTLKFAFFHYPLYSDNPSQPSDTFLQGLNNLEGMLGQYGVDITFNGHAHIYERNLPSATGMPVSYITGTGGSTLEPIGPCHPYDAYGIGWSPTKLTGSACGAASAPTAAANVFSFLKVTVTGNSVTVTPTDETGRTFDVQTYTFTNVPDTVIDSAPPPLTNAGTATFTFHSTRILGATYNCSLDGAAATSCTSPISYSGLGSGSHTFSVAATTADGTDQTPATASWTVDVTPPTAPANLVATATSATSVALSWTAATDNSGVIAGYDVQRNGVTIGSANVDPTGTPATSYLDATAAPSTSYQYTVVARDAAGNASPPSAPAPVTTPASTGLPTLVQSAASSTTTVTLAGPSAPGDLLVLTAGVYTGATKPITAVSDGRNTWTKAGAYTIAGQNSDGEVWYAANAAPARTITVTTAAPVALQVQEFTNMANASVPDGAVGAVASGKAANSGSVTPTIGNDLAVGFVAGHASAQAITVTSPGYTLLPQQTTTGTSTVSVLSGYQVLPGTSAQAFTASFTNTMYWADGLTLFKAAAQPDDFSLSASPTSVSVVAGQGGSSVISSTVTNGNPQTVALAASGLPTGATASFTPASVTAGQSATLTLSTSGTTAPGSYPITVTGTGTSATHTTTVTLTVAAPPPPDDFSIAAAPTTLSVTAGQNGTSTISTAVTSGNPQNVTLSSSGAPAGVTVAFNPTSVTAGQSSTATIATSSSTPAGDYPITITGTGTSATHGISITLTVTAASNPGPQLVQAVGATEASTSTTLTATLPAASTGGDLLVLSASVYTGTTNHITSVTDSAGNVWQRANAWSTASHNSDGEVWYAVNALPTTSIVAH
ncbi:MAG TPA: fibronectin type III domain-containing protein [Jatrophihabitans sp.]|nr:fibronectin type III domain-containing protein [Jatrophihabitans sp.]